MWSGFVKGFSDFVGYGSEKLFAVEKEMKKYEKNEPYAEKYVIIDGVVSYAILNVIFVA